MKKILLVAMLAAFSSAQAATDVWTNAFGDGHWSTAGNWSLGHTPGAGDDAVFDGGFTSAGSVMDASFTITNLIIQDSYSGTVSLASSLTAINGATINGSLLAGSTASFIGGVAIGSGGQLVAGIASTVAFGMGVDVLGGGTLEAQAASALLFGAGSTSTVHSGGLMSVDGGSPGTRASLRSLSPSTPWLLDLQLGSSSHFAFVNVQDSNAVGLTAIADSSSFNAGNNQNWSFQQTSPIPEPETYAMLLAGLGLLGFAARRRRTSAST